MTKKLICSVCGKTVTEKELKEYYNDKTVNAMMNGELEVVCPSCSEEGNDIEVSEWDGLGGDAFSDGMIFRGGP